MRNVATKLLNSMLFLDIANGDVISASFSFCILGVSWFAVTSHTWTGQLSWKSSYTLPSSFVQPHKEESLCNLFHHFAFLLQSIYLYIYVCVCVCVCVCEQNILAQEPGLATNLSLLLQCKLFNSVFVLLVIGFLQAFVMLMVVM